VHHSVTNPAYVALLLAHVVAAVLGYGALGTTGAYARAARRSADPFSSATLAKFFGPGRPIASRLVLLVPILGGALVLASGRDAASAAYPWIGLVLWLTSAGIAYYLMWPAESTAQDLFANARDRADLRQACLRLEVGAALTSLIFLAALVVMIGQP